MAGDVDLRKVRYFVALADEGNFTRAAASLHIAQPVLSRQIRELEHELGGALVIRHPRRLELTPAGAALARDGRRLLAAAAHLIDDVRSIATGARSLALGHHRALSLYPIVSAFTAKHSGIGVTIVPLEHGDEARAVLAGTVDIAVVCLPSPPDGVASTVLGREPTMAALASAHELARRSTLSFADLARFDRARFDSAGAEGRTVRDADDRLDLIAGSTAVHLVPEVVARRHRRPDVTFIPVADAPPTPILALWDAGRESRLVADLIAIALDAADVTPGDGSAGV